MGDLHFVFEIGVSVAVTSPGACQRDRYPGVWTHALNHFIESTTLGYALPLELCRQRIYSSEDQQRNVIDYMPAKGITGLYARQGDHRPAFHRTPQEQSQC